MLQGQTRHELACASCGAPLHVLKQMPAPEPRPMPSHGKASSQKPLKKKKKSKKKRKDWFEDIFDAIEDIFD